MHGKDDEGRAQREELEARIAELEGALTQLKARLRAQQEAEQHAAIDELDDYLAQIDHKYQNLRSFWTVVAQELREMFGPRQDDEGSAS